MAKKNRTYGGLSKEEAKKQGKLGKKQIADATLIAKKTETPERFEIEDVRDVVSGIPVNDGEKNAPPLELDAELNAQLVEEEKEKDKKREENRTSTKHYENHVNKWRLIAKTYNDVMDWEFTTMAMNIEHGVLVIVKEAIGQKFSTTMTFVPGAKVKKNSEGQYYI